MRVSERGQITIPKKLRERLGLGHNVEVEMEETGDGLFIRKREAGQPGEQGAGSAQDGHGAVDGKGSRFPWGETAEERAARGRRMVERMEERKRQGLTGVDLVAGIGDDLHFDIDEYIEEIRGR